jgi:TRAP-type C4-dicarboxylate transport system substrate-binding protein
MHSLIPLAVILKMATLAPEGSSWMKLFHEFQVRVEQRTDGRIKFKFYAGGVQGDEKDMIRKMRAGQLSGAAITGIGLALINPEVRALEAARTYKDLDHARERLDPLLRKTFLDKGYVLMGWGDVGPVHIFSQRPIKSLEDLRLTKLWMPSDDPTTKEIFKALELRGVPFGVPEVLPALSTGSLDAFLGSPLSTLALQWSAHARYVTSMVIGMATGATVLTKTAWDQITAEDQKIMNEEAARMQSDVITLIRRDNDNAMQAMQQKGMLVVPTPPEMVRELAKRTAPVALKESGSFSKEFQAEVQKLVEEYKNEHPDERSLLEGKK